MKTATAPVYSVSSLADALRVRADHPDATVIAGGTDVMVFMEAGSLEPREVLNIWGCSELRGISSRDDGGLRFGALTTFRDIRDDERAPQALRDCARTLGAIQIQNRATVGGNIVNASPAGDSLPMWLAMDAVFELASVRGLRSVAASDFWTGYRQVDLAPDELLVAVEIPDLRGDSLVYRKVGTRLAQAISKVVLGGRLRFENGQVKEARVALGSVAPVPMRCRSVEAALEGGPVDPAAADRVIEDIHPIDDVRSTANYRLTVARNVTNSWLCQVGPPA